MAEELFSPAGGRLLIFGLLCAANAVLGWLLLYRRQNALAEEARPLSWLLLVLPFASGGFYTFLAVPVGGYLLWYLARQVRRQKGLRLRGSLSFCAVALLPLSYAAAICWAADRGMAPLGLVQTLPLLLFALVLLQLRPEAREDVYALVPLGAAEMVLLSFLLSRIPALSSLVLVNQRLAGFFEYPNTFAVYLIAALLIVCTRPQRGLREYLLCLVLLFGLFQSGSRAAMLVLLISLVLLVLLQRSVRQGLVLLACLALSAGATALLSGLSDGSGYDALAAGSSTMLGRLLYAKDLLPVILRHPFGLGYLGYQAMQGSFQHGVYSVAYAHNELLQLLIDVGWLPTALCVAAAALSLFRRGSSTRQRLLLMAILGHSLVDFDLQFLSIWFLLLPTLQLDRGRELRLRRGTFRPMAAVLGACLAVSLWLSSGDLLYLLGDYDAALAVTPFHSRALEQRLTELEDTVQLDETAQRLLALDPYSILGHDARANAAYAAGDIRTVMEQKELAISCGRYRQEEYLDYFEKLYAALQAYAQAGDTASAQVCRDRLLQIPEQMAQVLESTDPLGWRIADQPQLALPESYQAALDSLAAISLS